MFSLTHDHPATLPAEVAELAVAADSFHTKPLMRIDLGEIVVRKCSEVIIVPRKRMPTKTGATAIYRFR